ncbi:MAG: hypothetical protein Q8K96_17555 [Rubrivivax sp.]|nr:hypothetical protein [Rubrivivax sp.]
MATNGSTYSGRVDFNTSTFAVYNGSFVVNIPGHSSINLSYQDPVPASYENWCVAYPNMWCSPTVGSNYQTNQIHPSTYYYVADNSALNYSVLLHLNDLSPLTSEVFVFASNVDYYGQSFASNNPCTSVFPDPDLCIDPALARATEVITLLGTSTVDGPGSTSNVVEPGSLALVSLALGGLAVSGRKRRQ